MLSDYEQRVEKTMEELALLQLELEESKESNQEQVARLRGQLKETEDELMVLHIKHQKYNDESEHRRSRLSSASFSSQEEMTPVHSASF
jgi:FtsZ-binding cell division protein ZapB